MVILFSLSNILNPNFTSSGKIPSEESLAN